MRYLATIALIFAANIAWAANFAWAADAVDYARDIAPLLQRYCVGCHTADDPEGGLVMESHDQLMSGGASGVAITGGSPASSRMMLMITGKLDPVMPPEGEERPSESEVEALATWIEQGAPGPDGEMVVRRELRTPKIEPAPGVTFPITAIAFSPDGSLRAIARYGNIELRRADDSVAATLSDGLGKVNSIEFSSDGSRLLVGSGVTGSHGHAVVFSTETGEVLSEMIGHRDVLYAATFSPDELWVATAGYDREIILWDASTGQPIRTLRGHNGAIFDLAFSPSGKVLVSACADETVKIWNVNNGERLDTLNQSEGEVFAVDVTSDGKFVLAGSSDNRLRVWALKSKNRPRINPIVATRFIDESPLVNFKLTPDGQSLVVLSASGNVKVIRTQDWNQAAALEPLGETGSDLSISPDGKTLLVSLMDGTVVKRKLPKLRNLTSAGVKEAQPVYMDLGELTKVDESKAASAQQENQSLAQQVGTGPKSIQVSRGVEISGVIAHPGEADHYRWQARKGEAWAIDADAAEKSSIDPTVTVLDANNQRVLRTRLQAVRDSYFTFRGKDSMQTGDFRMFSWREMKLNDYLYASGEVTRLFMHPRGPDSGFNVYPNEATRWTYFGTTHTAHALGEPAYIVRPLGAGESATANGLPIFDVFYENDDDPMRIAGKNSRLVFVAPSDGMYKVRISDTRGDGGEDFAYRMKIRAAAPTFKASVAKVNGTLRRGSGREFRVRVDRFDGFDGAVTFDLPHLPPSIVSNMPVTIEPGQRYADGLLWVSEDAEEWTGKISPEIIASAEVAGRRVERRVGVVGELTLGDRPNAIPSIHPIDSPVAENENWVLRVRRGETAFARVAIRRKEGFTREVSFGKENAGRNTSHGVYVDNIGLNGLLVRENEDEREFALTADPVAQPGKRSFFLTAAIDGNVTTHPITVEVLP